MADIANRYVPDYAIHPGEYLEEVLETREVKKRDFAERAGLSVKAVSQIINGKALYSPEVALMFEKTLGIHAEVWVNMAEAYQLFQARKKDLERLKSESTREWVKKFPVADLKRIDVIPDTKKIEIVADSLLRFLGVSDPHTWEEYQRRRAVLYRRSSQFKEYEESTAVWLHLAGRKAEEIDTSPFDRENFRTVLQEIRSLTVLPTEDVFPKLQELCASAGIALVKVPELQGTHISGASYWLTQNKALIALTLRYKSNDHLWFTFFHEAAHILLHGKKAIYIDTDEGSDAGEEEREADKFAGNLLIPPTQYGTFVREGKFFAEHIQAFADRIGIHPGIVVGCLQHDGYIRFSWHNDLKEKI